MLACDANADVFPVVASLGDRKYICVRRLNFMSDNFSALLEGLTVLTVTSSDMAFLKQKRLFLGLESWFSFSAWLCFENIKVTVGVFVIILSLRARSPFGGILRSQARAACERRRESERLCHPLARSCEACLTY